MIAYSKLYLANAQKNLALAFDYAVHYMDVEFGAFYNAFAASTFGKKFASGDPYIISGMSGIELAMRVIYEKKVPHSHPRIMRSNGGRSPEYWAGWALSYFQWESGFAFSKIAEFLSADELLQMYPKYHEMDISSFCDKLAELKEARQGVSPLKRLRQKLGLSQTELSTLSGVPLRTLQQYEQRQKDIKKAQAQYVLRLASVLSCSPAELLD